MLAAGWPGVQTTSGTSTQAPPSCELATAASMNAMPATPSVMPGWGNGGGTVSPRGPRIAHSSVRCRLASASWNPSGWPEGSRR